MWLVCVEWSGALLTLRNSVDNQLVASHQGDRGSTTFYPAPNNRPSILLYAYPKL